VEDPLVNCRECNSPLSRALGLVKDGAVYEAFRCPTGHYALVDMRLEQLPVEVSEHGGVCAARFFEGTNWYLFDRRLFRTALRPILKRLREKPADLVLDLSQVSFVAEPLLTTVRFLANGLRRRGKALRIINASPLVTTEILAMVPGLDGHIFTRSEEAYAAAGMGDTG
jgi:hypothetical protein